MKRYRLTSNGEVAAVNVVRHGGKESEEARALYVVFMEYAQRTEFSRPLSFTTIRKRILGNGWPDLMVDQFLDTWLTNGWVVEI